mmetsp:Transcript_47913/g.133569  ORF Transcript_47913/g.133569 Transcript_47913/m.133569 type:complete len:348 (+) Transcript_47913:400-1443(+)
MSASLQEPPVLSQATAATARCDASCGGGASSGPLSSSSVAHSTPRSRLGVAGVPTAAAARSASSRPSSRSAPSATSTEWPLMCRRDGVVSWPRGVAGLCAWRGSAGCSLTRSCGASSASRPGGVARRCGKALWPVVSPCPGRSAGRGSARQQSSSKPQPGARASAESCDGPARWHGWGTTNSRTAPPSTWTRCSEVASRTSGPQPRSVVCTCPRWGRCQAKLGRRRCRPRASRVYLACSRSPKVGQEAPHPPLAVTAPLSGRPPGDRHRSLGARRHRPRKRASTLHPSRLRRCSTCPCQRSTLRTPRSGPRTKPLRLVVARALLPERGVAGHSPPQPNPPCWKARAT